MAVTAVQLQLGQQTTPPPASRPFTDLGVERCDNPDRNQACQKTGVWDWERGAVLCEHCREET